MTRIEVAVMEPKYQQNLGYIARVCKNFGVERLVLINPRCNHNGREAVKYSKHARELLENARVLSSPKRLDTDLLIGTTGVWHKTNASYYNVYALKDIGRMAKRFGHSRKRLTLLLGRDDTGLSREELRLCDATLFIQASKEYPILNISHALAIMLNALSGRDAHAKFIDRIYADSGSMKNVFMLFDMLLDGNPKIRDRKGVSLAFRHMVRRSVPTSKEMNAISIALAIEHKNRKRRK